MVTVDRFDLEQNILKCWNVVDDVNLLYSNVLERDLTKDEIANYLLGISTIYEMKFQQLFDTFENMLKDKQIKTFIKENAHE